MTSAVRLEEPIPISQKAHTDTAEPKTTKEAYNPYLAARREWDEGTGTSSAANGTGESWRSSVRWSLSLQSAE